MERKKRRNLKSETSEGFFDFRFRGTGLNPKSSIRIGEGRRRIRTRNSKLISGSRILVWTISMGKT